MGLHGCLGLTEALETVAEDRMRDLESVEIILVGMNGVFVVIGGV